MRRSAELPCNFAVKKSGIDEELDVFGDNSLINALVSKVSDYLPWLGVSTSISIFRIRW
jgi:hypothetical protein